MNEFIKFILMNLLLYIFFYNLQNTKNSESFLNTKFMQGFF